MNKWDTRILASLLFLVLLIIFIIYIDYGRKIFILEKRIIKLEQREGGCDYEMSSMWKGN